ncbi:dethiobiotin synthase [Paenibacillus sp. L3-i20]|uniref:dethiobiotin synthase n=1 Tax=Paenibacillus sp. L3-i20 TaxID=2905833 RepID=UPI001EDD8189|nr:dethiobiotin synthase [Paenibacillus sp. L3-i20]GKU77413.1 ATP-dependent dethiobiotin synthetase BioD [Paenibacillus sp. L3-i20]
MSQIRGIFVTGTDTAVGKTIVTAALSAALRTDGMNIGIWKPVQSGALLGSGTTDAELLLKYTGINELPQIVATYSFEAPLTPLLAAKEAGVSFELHNLVVAGTELLMRYESLIIEGAGGVAVPLTSDYLVADFIRELQIPALIVARSGLGTINHTLLTISYLKQHSIPIIGFIFNDGVEIDKHDDPSIATNAALIERYSGITFLGQFPHLKGEITSKLLINAAREHIRLPFIKEILVEQAVKVRCES